MKKSYFDRKRLLFRRTVPAPLAHACLSYLRSGPWNRRSSEYLEVDRGGFEPRVVGDAFLTGGAAWKARRLLGMPDDLFVSDMLASDGLGLQVGGEVTRADRAGDVIAFDPMRRHALLPGGRRELRAVQPSDWERLWCGIHFVLPRGEFERWTMCLAGRDPLARLRTRSHQSAAAYA